MSGPYRFGWRPDIPDKRDKVYAAPFDASLPPLVDLLPRMPAVYDQGDLGSCTANAIAAALEYDRIRQQLDVWVPSRLQIYYNERLMEGTVNEDAGAMIRDGVKVVNRVGAAHEALWPYDITKFTQAPPQTVLDDAKLHPAVSYTRVTNWSAYHTRHCLAVVGPIVVGISVYESFMEAADGNIPMPSTSEQLLGGHAILLIGYDDTRKLFKFRNSWGVNWGQNGYGTIPYAYIFNSNLSDDAWSITLVK